jgi:vacuolar-type H+-ATPase catalytic subunit A/Vma1
MLWRLAAICLATAIAAPAVAQQKFQPVVPRGSLTRVANDVIAVIRADDPVRLKALLAPKLQAIYPMGEITRRLQACQHIIAGITTIRGPFGGGRTWGFYEIVGTTNDVAMQLEIDPNQSIVHLVITHDIDLRQQSCTLSHTDVPKISQ